MNTAKKTGIRLFFFHSGMNQCKFNLTFTYQINLFNVKIIVSRYIMHDINELIERL